MNEKEFREFVRNYFKKMETDRSRRANNERTIQGELWHNPNLGYILIEEGIPYLERAATSWDNLGRWHHTVIVNPLDNAWHDDGMIKKVLVSNKRYMQLIERIIKTLPWPPNATVLSYVAGPTYYKKKRGLFRKRYEHITKSREEVLKQFYQNM